MSHDPYQMLESPFRLDPPTLTFLEPARMVLDPE